jgi:uncharacterized membrane protein (Fun14 family)
MVVLILVVVSLSLLSVLTVLEDSESSVSKDTSSINGIIIVAPIAITDVIPIVTTIIVGLFIAGLAYLQYQQIASFNWDRIEGTISTIANATTNSFNDHNIESLATTNLGIPLTGGMSAGFAIGFMKG